MRRPALSLLGGVGALGVVGGGLALFSAAMARQVEAAVPPQGRFLEVDGNRIHYVDVGSGPTIVMVHGLGGQMSNFTYALVDRLKDRFRVVVLERPGSGYSERAPGASARLGMQADVVAGFIAKLGLERPLLVGHSMGGALALGVAVRRPESICGLALLSPLTQPQESIPVAFRALAIRSPWLRRLIASTLATPMTMAMGKALLAGVFWPEPVPLDYATRGGGLLGLRPRAFYSTSTDLMAVAEDLPAFAARYGELRLPVGVIFGADDRVLDAAVHGRGVSAQVPGLVYEEIPGAGHMIPVTRAPKVAEFIARMADQAFGSA